MTDRDKGEQNPRHSPPSPNAEIFEGPTSDPFRGRSRLERAFLPFVREPTLWPVLLAVVAHFVALVSPLIILTFRDHNGWATCGLLLVVGLSGSALWFDIRDRGRPGLVTAMIAGTWVACGVGTWLAYVYNLF